MLTLCKRCLGYINLVKDDYCRHCGRKLKGRNKTWHNIKDWFRFEYIGKYVKSAHRFGIFSYAIFIAKLRFKNRKDAFKKVRNAILYI